MQGGERGGRGDSERAAQRPMQVAQVRSVPASLNNAGPPTHTRSISVAGGSGTNVHASAEGY